VNQPYVTFNITKGTNAPHSLGSPGDAQAPISDEGLTPIAAATKGASNDTPDIIKMLVKHGSLSVAAKYCAPPDPSLDFGNL